MTLETLDEANRTLRDLRKWNDRLQRMTYGTDFYRIKFDALTTKSMPENYTYDITDEEIHALYKAMIEFKIKELEEKLTSL